MENGKWKMVNEKWKNFMPNFIEQLVVDGVGWMFGECLWWQKKFSNADENIELFHYKIGSIDSLIE